MTNNQTGGQTQYTTGRSIARWGILILVLAIIGVGLWGPSAVDTLTKEPDPDGGSKVPGGSRLAVTWFVVAILMLGIIICIGLSLGKGWAGILIDPARNAMSLSRLQVVLWTWVILSAFVTIALGRAWDSRFNSDSYYACQREPAAGQEAEGEIECTEPLGIQLPPLLWALMGISITSAVGSPLLKAAKAQRTEEDDLRRERDAQRRGTLPEQVATYSNVLEQRKLDDPAVREAVSDAGPSAGAFVRKDSWRKATFSDVFTGEEVSNFGYVDVAKVQNFFFTMITVVSYTVLLAVTMGSALEIADFFAFPDLPVGLIAVISISHAGYLTDKAFTHSTPSTLLEMAIDFRVDKEQIKPGETITLTWNVQNADIVTLDGEEVEHQGSRQEQLTTTKTWSLHAERPGSLEKEVTVSVVL